MSLKAEKTEPLVLVIDPDWILQYYPQTRIFTFIREINWNFYYFSAEKLIAKK